MALLPTQRNRFFELITECGESPTYFRWSEVDVDKLNYVGPRADDFYFFFRVQGAKCLFSPGSDSLDGFGNASPWDFAESNFRNWIKYVRREVDAPDLWAEVEQLRALVKADADSFKEQGDLPLVGAEHDRFVAAMNQVRELLETKSDANAEQLAAMRASIDRVEQGGRQLGRKDLLTWVLGCIAAPVFSQLITIEHGQWMLVHILQYLTAVQLVVAPVVPLLGG